MPLIDMWGFSLRNLRVLQSISRIMSHLATPPPPPWVSYSRMYFVSIPCHIYLKQDLVSSFAGFIKYSTSFFAQRLKSIITSRNIVVWFINTKSTFALIAQIAQQFPRTFPETCNKRLAMLPWGVSARFVQPSKFSLFREYCQCMMREDCLTCFMKDSVAILGKYLYKTFMQCWEKLVRKCYQ